MAKVVKPAGKTASESKRGSMHGSKHERELARMEGNDRWRDGKPSGFLSWGRNNSPPTKGR